jgi:hypothetical protein
MNAVMEALKTVVAKTEVRPRPKPRRFSPFTGLTDLPTPGRAWWED